MREPARLRQRSGDVSPNRFVRRSAAWSLLAALLAAGCAAHRDRPAAAPAPAGTTWLIFVDGLHLDFRNTGYMRKLLHSLVRGLIVEGDVVAIRSTGPFPSLGLTSDRAQLGAAIDRLAGSGLKWSEIHERAPHEAQREIDLRFSVAIRAAAQMANQVTPWPGRRRAMLYISNGYQLANARKRVATIARAARRNNVTVFVMDPRALPGVPVRRDDSISGVDPSTRESLEGIAAGTGGFAVVEHLHLDAVIARINTALRR